MFEPTFRPLITVIRVTPDNSCVEVTLEMEARVSTGFGDVRDDDLLRAAGEGTCAAVRKLTDDHVIELDWIRRFTPEGDVDGPAVVNSAVTLRRPGGATETLLGAAIQHHDLAVAGVRATMDGLTRRLGFLLLR